MAGYRRDVLTNPHYECDEPIGEADRTLLMPSNWSFLDFWSSYRSFNWKE
jgi:hypothetical protein